MKTPKNSALLTAALAGILSGTATRALGVPQDGGKVTVAQATPDPKHGCAGKNACKGTGGCATDGSKKNKAKAAGVTEKHACAGQNSCKGNGGCATDHKKKAA